ncbi:2-hydroxychromene-2-carboxylate isomerase [Roseicella aquatilis]|uniref:2-hydroxychromene-2-carboxylate isomerase n=1 Tax=Roseicella aquatilis TaxID=2527868 RepID=A0A4R4DYT7_9PROT|nr:2-hydroxychromene-2-carboxylate isomerase [Roseicella aquatilis]TCZ66556.1 2-hydroxychromene-2-carboxylate isomerase [Roseicella aquatilis]
MTERVVECFYTLSSPWMYLAGPRLRQIAQRHDARVVLRPYDFQQVVPRTGGIPLRTRPQPRQDYHALELDRWRRQLDMPLTLKPRYYPPADQRPAGRMVMVAQARGLDAQALSHAILTALWAEERDIALPEVRAAIGEALGLPGAALVAAEGSPAIHAEWERNNAEAVARGVFGSPTFFLGDLWLWGQDRLPFLERALAGEAVQTP